MLVFVILAQLVEEQLAPSLPHKGCLGCATQARGRCPHGRTDVVVADGGKTSRRGSWESTVVTWSSQGEPAASRVFALRSRAACAFLFAARLSAIFTWIPFFEIFGVPR